MNSKTYNSEVAGEANIYETIISEAKARNDFEIDIQKEHKK